MEEFYVGIYDCEMTGPRLSKHALINLGIVIKRITDNVTIDSLNLVFNLPEGRIWDQGTREWMLRQPELSKIVQQIDEGKGLSIKEGMDKFVEFLKRHRAITDGRIVLGSDRIGVDNAWINLWLDLAGHDPLYLLFGDVDHQIDVSSYHQGCSHTTHSDARKFSNPKTQNRKFSPNVAAMRHFGIPSSGEKYTHVAIDDATAVATNHVNIINAIATVNESFMIDQQWRQHYRLDPPYMYAQADLYPRKSAYTDMTSTSPPESFDMSYPKLTSTLDRNSQPFKPLQSVINTH